MTPITRQIAQRVAGSRFEDISDDVTRYSKTLAISALGAMVAGPKCVGSDIVTRYVRRAGGAPSDGLRHRRRTSVRPPPPTRLTRTQRSTRTTAFRKRCQHTLFPAIFARRASALRRARGAEAFVLAYETQARIGLACAGGAWATWSSPWPARSVRCRGPKLLRLDERRTINAISIAASQGSGLGLQTGSMAHIVEMGFAARNGLTAALLAADGYTGQPDVLEAPRGLFNIITAGKVENIDAIVADWGRPYRVLEVGIKQYPCCYHLQRIIEATLGLRESGRLCADEVEAVEVEVNAFFPTVVQYAEPRHEIEAQFSLPHAVAAALVRVPSTFDGKDR